MRSGKGDCDGVDRAGAGLCRPEAVRRRDRVRRPGDRARAGGGRGEEQPAARPVVPLTDPGIISFQCRFDRVGLSGIRWFQIHQVP